MLLKAIWLFSVSATLWGHAARSLLVAAQQVDGLSDVVVATVRSLSLDVEEVSPIRYVVAIAPAVPSLRDVGPFKQFFAPAVKDHSFERNNTLVAILHLENVVNVVTIGRKGIGNF
mgnify:CR=1 FL=1